MSVIVRVPKPKTTLFSPAEKRAVAAFLWDRYLPQVEKLGRERDWGGLLHILTQYRLKALEDADRMRRVAGLMFGQHVKVRSDGKVYPCDARLYLDRAAAKYDTDPEGLRDLAAQMLVGLRTGAIEWAKDAALRRLLRDVGINPDGREYRGRYAPQGHRPDWPPVGQIA